MQQLSPQDAQFLYMESDDSLTHVTSIVILDPTTVPGGKAVRFKEILAHVEGRIHMSPLFRRRLVRVPLELDFPYWVDDEKFDLEYHVKHGRLPEPGDWRQFCIHMARYHSRPLDMNRPLWEMYVVEGLDNVGWLPKGSYALATKIHHAAVDGSSIIGFANAMADIDNKGTPAVPLNNAKLNRNPQPSLLDMAVRATWHTIRSPIGMIDGVMRAAPGLYKLAQGALRSKGEEKYRVPETRFNCPASPHKMFDATSFPLQDLKGIRKAVPGSTINDVVLAVCSGGLRQYLTRHDELPDDSLVAWVPINARPTGAVDSDRPGNNLTSMTTPIFTDVEDPIERLRYIHRATQRSKQTKAGVSARLMTDLSKHAPAATQVMAGRLVLNAGLAARMCNLFISNVPGPQVPLYMNGARQVATYGLAPLVEGMGLFIATPSYNGQITFAVTSTRDAMPDIRLFVTCLEKAMAELKRAAKPIRQRDAG
ncbi:MAG: wax ester/triacylglycerol synthase family O-acyltransferase [Gammaproteobacteria bacterium]|nr:wax ester/triacylglycerol synthase family O-acyltransferase [Gammaproteobacteria bacterium]MDH3750093.1 wax ester/triacylglycerol synthase family O-acyltransferase [Gammaproteobacteria bacterium]MDH3806937.1 wax ester/triacylglycerol synthase family O-acyltransferase [Gammaproteobacteria bacterium]